MVAVVFLMVVVSRLFTVSLSGVRLAVVAPDIEFFPLVWPTSLFLWICSKCTGVAGRGCIIKFS